MPSRSPAFKLPDSKSARARLAAIIREKSFGRGEITLASGADVSVN
jgi:hypothetical protein